MCRREHVSLECCASHLLHCDPLPSKTISCDFLFYLKIGTTDLSLECVLLEKVKSLERAEEEGIEAETVLICSHP